MRIMGKKIVFLVTVCSIFLVVVFFQFFTFRTSVNNPTAKIASATKNEGWSSTAHLFSFTVEVIDNGTVAANGTIVVIKLYHDWMNISWPVSKYTIEVQDYYFNGSISANIFALWNNPRRRQ